jgi:uncharacterized protein (DUF433 family)
MNRVKRLITIDKEIQFGTPVFAGTRTPIFTLFEFMKGGWSLDYYLENFPSVSKKQAEEAIAIAEKFLTSKKLASLYENLTGRKRPKTIQTKSKKSSRIKR